MATLAPPPRHDWQHRLEAFAPTFPVAAKRRIRLAFLAIAAAFAVFAIAGFIAVPPIARWQIEKIATAELGRQASVGKVDFNPFTLRARVSGFTLADRAPGRTLLAFESIDVDVSTASLRKLAPVLDAVRLRRPRLEIVRNGDGRLNVQDLVDRALAPSTGDSARPMAFAVSNIEVEDGSIVFDDALKGHRSEVTHLAVGIPFLSSFASDVQIRVDPYLKGVVDGAPFAFHGRATSPFEDTQRATLDINFEALPLPRYAEYAPLPNGLRLADGTLTTRLALAFLTWKGAPRGITLTGSARVDQLALARADGSPLAAVRMVEARLGTLDPLGRSIGLERIAIAGPTLDLRRQADGSLEFQRLLARLPVAGAAEPAASWSWSVSEATVSDGALQVLDESVVPAFRTRLSAVTVTGARLASRGPAGTIDVSFETEDGARFAARADVDVAGKAARGRIDLAKLPIARANPYLAAVLALDVRRGLLDFGADLDAAADPLRFTLAAGRLAVSDLELALRGERQPLLRMAGLGGEGMAFDLAERSIAIDRVEMSQPWLRLARGADGQMQFQRVLRVPPGAATSAGEEWHALVRTLQAERLGVDFEDRAVDPAVRLRVTDARIVAENVDSRPGAKANVEASARVGAKGRLQAKGVISARPPAVEARIDAAALDLVPLRPYLEAASNVVVTSGVVGAKGRVAYADAGTAGARASYVGDVVVSDFGSLDRPGSQELLRFKRLSVDDADLHAGPFKLAVKDVALDRFYARLILAADARLNLMQLLRREAAAGAPESAPAADPAAPAAKAEREAIPASIGKVRLTNGEVEFSDYFVKPNYSVHLKELNGTVSGLAMAQAGTVEIDARVDGSAPVEIRGTVNPFAKELALDVTGKATGVDLPPLTPYSAKYAGYGIEKGKLSMQVQYKLDDRKLAASNRLVLDQLTFGERVDSPTATKLPVLLAVALLKDRNGVIDLDLPIQGTLDDPKFSVWRVVVQIIGNLLVKAATAPFALLGALVGGGEQLAYLEFAPGSAALSPAGEAKLASLSKALVERPALKLDIAGRAIPDADRDGLKRAALEHALRTQKQKELAAKGESAPPLAEIAIEDAERAKYLQKVYGDTRLPDKPRNFIGMAKDIPAEQMESMLLASYPVDEAALRELADHRAQAAKEWFAAKGGVPRERVFVVASRIGTEGLKGEGAATRVDFAIR